MLSYCLPPCLSANHIIGNGVACDKASGFFKGELQPGDIHVGTIQPGYSDILWRNSRCCRISRDQLIVKVCPAVHTIIIEEATIRYIVVKLHILPSSVNAMLFVSFPAPAEVLALTATV